MKGEFLSHMVIISSTLCVTFIPLQSSNVYICSVLLSPIIHFSLHRSFLGIWTIDCWDQQTAAPAAQFMFGWRWLIFPKCSNVSFLSHCTNDYSTAGGARGCEERGARERQRRPGTHHLPCGMPGCVRTAAKPHLSWKQNSPSAEDCSASIYQVFAKPCCKPIWISQSHLTGLGRVPVVAGSFTGLQHRERERNSLNYFHSTAQIPGWLCLTPATALARRKREQQTSWNALRLSGDEADFKSVGTERGNISEGGRL